MPLAPVSDIMTADVYSIEADLKVDVALELMRSNDVRRLPVVSSTNRVIGIITRAEARQAMPKGSTYFGETDPMEETPPVSDVMTRSVETITPDTAIAEAARRMVNFKVGALPVVKDHKLVGIITESDLFRYLADTLDPEGA